VFYDAHLDTVFWTFPNDRKMTNLRALFSPPESLSRLLGSRWTRSRLVAFAPEKCATAQCLDDDLNVLAYAKRYAGDGGRRACLIYRALRRSLRRGDCGLRLPRALAYSEEHRTLLLESAEGLRIADLRDAELTGGFRLLGEALAALHSLRLPGGLPTFKRLEAEKLERAARVVGVARPDLSAPVRRLADTLRSRRETASDPGQLVCLHGDVHPKNAVLRGDSLTLIDLDQSGVGPAAADLGSLLAALSYSRLVGLLSPSRERELSDAFLAGYAAKRTLPSDVSLRWHTAAALLAERALRAVNRIRPEGLRHLGEILVGAERLTRGGRE
jgi:tRNA A-37 threonylcarbamoyl transferase component Bud32